MGKRLGVGFVGGGHHARLHLNAWNGTRDADVLGVWSLDQPDAAATVAAKPYPSITAMIADPAIDALWLCGAGATRLEHMEEIADAVIRAAGKLVGFAAEAPLAPDTAAAQRITELAAHTGLKHGLLEPFAFAPAITDARTSAWSHGRPRAVRVVTASTGEATRDAARCRALVVARLLLTEPGAALSSLQPRHLIRDAGAINVVYQSAGGLEVSAAVGVGPHDAVEIDGTSVALTGSDTAGYSEQNAHYVRAFLGQEEPLLTFEDGFDAVRLLTATTQDFAPAARGAAKA